MKANDQIVYEILPSEQWEDVVQIVKEDFVSNEPLNVYSGNPPEIFDQMYPGGLKKLIQDNVCVVARNGVGGAVVGLKIFCYMKRGEKEIGMDDLTPANEKVGKSLSFAMAVENGFDIFEEYPTIDMAYGHMLLVVRKDFGRRGIGTKLVSMSDEMATVKNCKYAKVFASSIESYKIFTRLGYEVVNEIEYETYELNGRRVFDPKLIKESRKAYFMIKKLQ